MGYRVFLTKLEIDPKMAATGHTGYNKESPYVATIDERVKFIRPVPQNSRATKTGAN
jgi:hypothetical protein